MSEKLCTYIIYILCIIRFHVLNAALIYQELFDNGLNGWTFTSQSNTASQIIIDCNNIQTNNCLKISERSTASKQISTINYKNIIIKYSIYINNNWDTTSNIFNHGAFIYSCGNNVLNPVFYYSVSDQETSYIDVEYTFPSDCDNISNMILYFNTMCYSDNTFLSVGNIRVSGTFDECQGIPTFKTPLFMDDFSNGINKWDVLSNIATDVSSKYCVTPPCIQLHGTGDIRIKNGVSTIGYKNIILSYDLNIGPNNAYGVFDNLRVYYSCDGSGDNRDVNWQSFTPAWSVYRFRYQRGLPCNNVNDLRVRFQNEAPGRDAFIDNVYIFGNLINSDSPTPSPSCQPTITPTIMPTLFPTITPTTVTTGPTHIPSSLPSITPTIRPTLTPSSLPSITPTKEPTNNPTISPSENPTLFPSVAPIIFESAPKTGIFTEPYILIYVGSGTFVLIACIFCGSIVCCTLIKYKKLKLEVTHDKPHSTSHASTDSNQVIVYNTSNKSNHISKISTEDTIVIEGNRSEVGVYQASGDNVGVHDIESSVNIVLPNDTNEGQKLTELNDKLIANEFQKSLVDRYHLTKGNLTENDIITRGNK